MNPLPDLSTPPTQYDLVIIGGACAGLAAALYAARRNLKTLVLTKNIGGQIATTPSVENYPGIDFITGVDLAQAQYAQALKWGAEVIFDEVSKIEKRGEQDFVITANQGSYQAKALILAYGKTPKSLDVPGEWDYAGRGVSYCVTCDAPLYRRKDVVVVGGGNSAVEGALILAETSNKVYLVHRRTEFRAEAVLMEQLKAQVDAGKVELVLSSVSKEVIGDGPVATGLVVTNVDDASERTLAVDGIFVEIGFLVNVGLIKELVNLDKMNQVITNNRQETSTSGVFAAGDLTDTVFKQAVISASEGAKAALTAYSYIHNGANPGVDWGGHS